MTTNIAVNLLTGISTVVGYYLYNNSYIQAEKSQKSYFLAKVRTKIEMKKYFYKFD